jgi:hypothetical protein
MRPHRYGGAWRAGVSYFAPLGDLAYLGFRRVARSQGNESKDEQSGWRCSAMKTTSEMPSGTASPPLAEILDAHAKMETEVGEIYVCFALSSLSSTGWRPCAIMLSLNVGRSWKKAVGRDRRVPAGNISVGNGSEIFRQLFAPLRVT